MAERKFDLKRTIVVHNIPTNVGEDQLTIHFQKEKNGGGDVDEIVKDGSETFVVFDLVEDATNVLKHKQIIDGKTIQVQSYETWLTDKKKDAEAVKKNEESDTEDAVTTIYVSGLKETTSRDAITLFFESKRRSGGGNLALEAGFKKISPTVARVTFESSRDAQNVLAKANEGPLTLEDSLLKVGTVLEPTHDRSILLVKNLNPETGEDLLRDFVESKKDVEVLSIVFGKDGTAIVILKEEIPLDENEETPSKADMKLRNSVISLEFAPLTKGIRIFNIPSGTTPDDIKYRFSNAKKGGGKVTDFMLDRNNGVANVYFEESSVVSKLVKIKHQIKDEPLTVIPYYDDFEVHEEIKNRTSEFSGGYEIEPRVVDFIMNHQALDKFRLKSMRFDDNTSTFHFTKEFDDSNDAIEFEKDFKEFLHSFTKEELKIPRQVPTSEVEKVIGSTESTEDQVIVKCEGSKVIFIGRKEHVNGQKQRLEIAIEKLVEEALVETQNIEIDDKNKLEFLRFIEYSKKLEVEFPGVQIHGFETSSGKVTLIGTKEKTRDVQLRILQDLAKIKEMDIKTTDRQTDFLQRTECKIVNAELKKDDAMLTLVSKEGVVGAKGLQAKIFTLKKCDSSEAKRLENTLHEKTSEQCIKIDKDTASFLTKFNKLMEYKKEQFDKNKILIDPELTDPCNIWIVCEKSKMSKAEQELTSLTDERKITSCAFKPINPVKIRFLKEHCWENIQEKAKSCTTEGVVIEAASNDSFQIKGTKIGRNEMITFLENLAGKVESKTYPLTEPGMKKQMSMETTDAIISDIEKNHKCIIERGSQQEKTEKLSDVVEDGGSAVAPVAATMNLPYQKMTFINDKNVKMTTDQRISIVVGDLAKEKVGAIVNTTNDKVDLKANPCGKALLKVAGKELLDECQKIGSLTPGQMASTAGWSLRCRRVYHVRSAQWDNGKGAPILRQLIKTCLDQLEKDKLTSIAIPAIGTGNLGFPRPEVAKIFFEEVTGYFNSHPQTAISDVRLVAYSGDQATVDAFLAAVQEIKFVLSSSPSKSTPVRKFKAPKRPIPVPSKASARANVTTTEKSDGSLELLLGSNLTVQVLCNDISKESTNLIMHVTNREFSFQGGVGKALIKAGGDSIVQECKALGQPGLFSTQFTNAGNLNADQIAHVIGTNNPTYSDLKSCLDQFFDELLKRKVAKVSFSSVGAGAMGFTEQQSADLIFDNLCRIADTQNPSLNLVRIVIFEKAKFDKFKDAVKAYFASGGAVGSSPKPSSSPKVSFSVFRMKRSPTVNAKDGGISVTIYLDNRGRIDKVWQELKRIMLQNIDEKLVNDEIIKKFADGDIDKLRKLERDFDMMIKVDTSKGSVKIKGHITDIATVQEEIRKILKDITVATESKVPDYWTSSLDNSKVHRISLPTNSPEYKKVDSEFRKTASNRIISIERIQNKGIYELYDVKRKAMMSKYGKSFAGKELMLFHGTSSDNIPHINAGGLNRNFAGVHATVYGKGVYFARDAIYSCQQKYSPPDPAGHRYMYYAKVLVGEYTTGSSGMLVPPPKNPANLNDRYNSAVDCMQTPSIYVMFQDYEYYTEYLITFQ